MKIESLGYRSELIFLNFDGEVIDRGSYVVARTLTNPNFFWGNLLIFDRAPAAGDLATWTQLFDREFNDPRIYHKTFAWDDPSAGAGNVAEFMNAGYRLEATAVLSAERRDLVKPARYNSEIEVRALNGAHEWSAMIDLQTSCGDDHLSKEEWRSFYEKQMPRYRSMVAAGLGEWYGAFIEGELVGGLGLFHSGKVGRYQQVGTHPSFRRQGIAATLVYEAAVRAFEDANVRYLVMCADPDYFAIDIYKSVGFKQVNTQYGVCWFDENHNLNR